MELVSLRKRLRAVFTTEFPFNFREFHPSERRFVEQSTEVRDAVPAARSGCCTFSAFNTEAVFPYEGFKSPKQDL